MHQYNRTLFGQQSAEDLNVAFVEDSFQVTQSTLTKCVIDSYHNSPILRKGKSRSASFIDFSHFHSLETDETKRESQLNSRLQSKIKQGQQAKLSIMNHQGSNKSVSKDSFEPILFEGKQEQRKDEIPQQTQVVLKILGKCLQKQKQSKGQIKNTRKRAKPAK